MDQGRIAQVGTPREIYDIPRNRFVADFVGTTNFLEGRVLASGRVQTPLGDLAVRSLEGLGTEAGMLVSVRPEDVELFERRPDVASEDNMCRGIVESRSFLGEHVEVHVKVGDRLLYSRAHPSLRAPVGTEVFAVMKAEKCIAIPD
jgi:iron(III) transport system ATP-binding protein